MKNRSLLRSIVDAHPLKAATFFSVLALLGALCVLSSSASSPVYDTLAAARRPLVIVNGVTQQLPTVDWISTVGGITTNATAPAAGEVETTTLTASGLATLTGGFTLGANSSAASHKITNLTDGSSAQDAAAFGQLATAVNAAVSGTANKVCKFTGTNAVGDGWASDDGTTWGVAGKFTITESTGAFRSYSTGQVDGVLTAAGVTNSGATVRSGVITPTLASSQNNYNPAGLATASQIDAVLTGNATITGLAAQPTGTEIVLRNTSNVYQITLSDNSGSSSTGNKFNFLSSVTLDAFQSITLRYTGTDWVAVGWGGGGYMYFQNLTVPVIASVGQLRMGVTIISTTGTVDNASPGNAAVLQYTGTNTATYTGFTGGANGRLLIVQNLSAYALTLPHNSSGSSAGRRWMNPGGVDIVLPAISSVTASASAAVYVYQGNWSLVAVTGAEDNSIPTLFTSAKNKGTITLSAGTGTATVRSGSVCTCSDTTAVNAVKCAVSSTTLTATGTGTDVIAYHCF